MSRKDTTGCRLFAKSGLLGLSIVSVLLLAAPAFSAEAKPLPAGPRGQAPSVSFRDGRLTVEANGQMLVDVLAEIKKKSGIKFTMRQTLPNDAVTASFRDVPIEAAIKRLVARDFDLVWFYAPPKSGRGAPLPIEVWVVGRGERTDAVVADKGAAPPSPKPVDAPGLGNRPEAAGDLADEPVDTALPPFIAALNDPHPQVRASAAGALGEIGSPEAVLLLRAGLADAESEVREAVVDALGSIGGPEAERLLRQALTDKDEDVREAASEALAKLAQTRK